MSKILMIVLACLLSFGGGYLLANWNFMNPDTYVSKEPISIVTNGVVTGSLPKGTTLYYQSFAHDEVDFYVFVRLPLEKAKLNTEEIEAKPGIKRIKGDFR